LTKFWKSIQEKKGKHQTNLFPIQNIAKYCMGIGSSSSFHP